MDTNELVAPVAARILGAAAEAEEQRRLPDDLMVELKRHGLFSIYTPKQFGGLELPLPEALRVVESVAALDGSTGWTVALGVANGYFLGALPEEGVSRIFAGGPALIAGAPGPGVRATAVGGGYRLTGQWAFNSGAWNADWMSVAAPVFDGEAPRMGPNGPEMVFAVLPPGDVRVIDTWHVTGLRATSTHDLRVDDVFVPAAFAGAFAFPRGPIALRESPLARFSLFTLLGLAQSPPVCMGIARHAIEEFRDLAAGKERPFGGRLSDQVQAQAGLARAEGLLRSARAFWYESVGRAAMCAQAGGEPSLEDRAELRIASLTAAENSVAAVEQLYRLAGTSAIYGGTALERCWRDVHTAAQHLQVQDARWQTAGRVLFGLEPSDPFI